MTHIKKVAIPLSDITELETKMSSIIIPNQIKVGTKLKTVGSRDLRFFKKNKFFD